LSEINLSGYYGDNFVINLNIGLGDGNIVITVRKQASQIIAYKIDVWGHNCWAISQSSGDYTCMVEGANGVNGNFNATLEVQKNTYILSVNGIETQRFTSTDSGTPFISISTSCGTSGNPCPSFDNFKVEPLP
jgi:hypothetical protein